MTPTRTPFAGYERLAPGDPLASDGYAFQFENPLIADRLGKLGAVTHKHDAHAAMLDPSAAATVALAGTGGTIPANLPIYVCYTLLDAAGGESLPTAAILVTTGPGYLTPAAAPTLAPDYSAGTMMAGTPLYAVTVSDGVGGETALGPAAAVTIDPGHANAQVQISGLTAITDASSGSSTTAMWRLWRSMDGGSSWNLMGTALYSTDTFTDSGAAGDCTVSPPFQGTTVGTSKLTVTVPSAGQPVEATFFNIYASRTSVFVAPALLGTYAIADFDVPQVYTALTLSLGEPPAVSQAYPGANQIDPATDIAGWEGGPLLVRGTSPTAITGLVAATETAETLDMLGPAMMLYAIEADAACRVRLYPTAALALADIARAASSDPDVAAQNGCYLEHTFAGSGTFILTPAVCAVMQEGSIGPTIAANVSKAAGGAVTVTLAGYRLE